MKKVNEIYNELRKSHSAEDVADSFIFSVDASGPENEREQQEFLRLRMERLRSLSAEEKVVMDLLAFKFRLQDYFKQSAYDEAFSFSRQLKQYIELSKRSNTDLASDLGLHKTKLSRLVNDRERPNIDLMYRLEEHSGHEIPATYWWRVYSRELENKIKSDNEKRQREADKVSNPLKLSA